MKIIINNPYRTIGLLADCTERDIQKQKGLIKRLLDVGKDISFDTDIHFPINCNRDSESISSAFAKVEQVKSRVTNGLFWFVNASHIDEPALNYLREGNSEKAIEIWTKTTVNVENKVTAKNCTAIHNLSTLKLGLAFYTGTIDQLLLSEGVSLKAKLLNSDFATDVIKRISNETFQLNKEEIIKIFADELLSNISPFLDRTNGITSTQFISIFAQTPENLKSYVSKKFVDKPLHFVETKIEECEKKRKENKSDAYKFGVELYDQTKNNLALLMAILGNSSLQYTMLADKIAEELLRCSTDYFNSLKGSDNDPGPGALKVTKLGEKVACGIKTKGKINDDIKYLEKWITNKPQRDKEKRIEAEFDFILTTLDEFENKEKTIKNAKALVTLCKPKLQTARTTLGSSDELYLTLSSRVGFDAQDMIVKEVNKEQDGFIKKVENPLLYVDKSSLIQSMRWKFEEAWAAILLVGTLDMNSNFRTKYTENKNTLQGLCSQMGINTSSYSSPASAKPIGGTNTSTNTNTNTTPTWLVWVGIIIIIFILAKACN